MSTTASTDIPTRRHTGTFVFLCLISAVLLIPVVWTVSTSLSLIHI